MAASSSNPAGAFHTILPSAATSGASSSGKNPIPYHVFINHCGQDVKHTLATRIYDSLNSTGLRVFLDKDELKSGDFFPKVIEEAMASASIHIAIFSEHYAESPWCLAELEFMVKNCKTIIPIFYHVDPSDLRWAVGGKRNYANAFREHEKTDRYTPQVLQQWKEALQQVSFCFGDMIKKNDDEQRVLKNAVNRVMEKLNVVPLEVAKHPVGLDRALQDFDTIALQSSGPIKIVGIWGMGGSGKTTLAKELYKRKLSTFDKSSFLFDLRDAAGTGRLVEKQKKLLEDLAVKDSSFDSVDLGKGILDSRLRSVTVLIILDDVDHKDQLNALLPAREKLGHGSLIVVTTRQLDVLKAWDIHVIYQMKALDATHAKELFCWHAFLQPSPQSGFEDLVDKFLNACDRLPLSLKVVGGQLYGETRKDHWQRTLNKLVRVLPKEIKERLKISYDALDVEEKEMFLDTACFFIGKEKNLAIEVWEGSGWDGLLGWETLLNKCLVEVNEGGSIRMHDHLRDLGRDIAKEKSPHRLWSLQQAIEILPQQEAVRVRGMVNAIGENCFQRQGKIVINTNQGERSLAPGSLGLKIFVGDGDFINQEHSEISRELLWLRCNRFEHKNLPSWLSLKKLRILEIFNSMKFEDLWEREADAPSQLRELVIQESKSLRGFPRSIGHLKNLKKIIIGFPSFIWFNDILSGLPEEFCNLQSLEHLEMESCFNLSSLPNNFGELTNLQHLNLRACKKLKTLPNNFGELTNLQHLNLSLCQKLKMLPDSFKKLKVLKYLNLGGCGELIIKSELHILENMTKLRYLNLYRCEKLEELRLPEVASLTELHLTKTSLKELPANISQLTKLTDLEIGSEFLTTLPTSLGNLSSLTTFKIQGCKKLESLSDSLEHHNLLRNIDIEHSGVKCLPKSFIHLQNLTIEDAPISEVSFGSGCMLKTLALMQTKVSKISIGGDCCPVLETLYLTSNEDLRDLETLPTSLKTIYVEYCDVLKNIGGVRGLKKLKDLCIRNCEELDRIPSLAEFTFLTDLELLRCHKLEIIESLQGLISLEELIIDDCPQLDVLPSLAESTSLKVFKLTNCHKLKKVEGLLNTRSLAKLKIVDCPELEALRSLAESTSLKVFKLKRCDKLEKIESLENTRSLVELRIVGCPELEALPSLAELTSLKVFKLKGRNKLKKIEGLERLRLLERLEVHTRWNAPCIVSLEQCERLQSLIVVANQRSAVKPFVSNIQKWPRDVMICTRVECDVWSLRNFFEGLPDVSVLDYSDVVEDEGHFALWRPESPPNANANAILICFIIDCLYPDSNIFIDTGPSFTAKLGDGNWVWMGVYTQDSGSFWSERDHIGAHDGEGKWERNWVGGVKVEEAWLVMGEEGRIVKAFHHLFKGNCKSFCNQIIL